MSRLLLAALTVAGFGPAAIAAPQAPNSCFDVRFVGDRSVADPHTLYFQVLDRSRMHTAAYFRVKVGGRCHVVPGANSKTSEEGVFDVHSMQPIPQMSSICRKEDLRITTGVDCDVESLVRLSPEEAAALPRQMR
jgi:hypothetical protein